MLRRALIGLGIASLSLGGCASEAEGPMDFESFKSAVIQEPDTGIYIVNGDEPLDSIEELYEYFLAFSDQERLEAEGLGQSQGGLTINVVNGQWDRWPAGSTLTYCISSKGFSAARKTAVINAFAAATADWSAAANIKFQYRPDQDASCNNRNNNVTFDVNYACRGQYVARAFFPSDSRRNRNVIIDCTAWSPSLAPWTLTGVLRHELGHSLGFRHEHMVKPGTTCPEGGTAAQLTAYDSDSVMHYPQCGGTQDGDLTLTATDRAGAAIAYP
jgi:serralysin